MAGTHSHPPLDGAFYPVCQTGAIGSDNNRVPTESVKRTAYGCLTPLLVHMARLGANPLFLYREPQVDGLAGFQPFPARFLGSGLANLLT
jgi:hypothetical protein